MTHLPAGFTGFEKALAARRARMRFHVGFPRRGFTRLPADEAHSHQHRGGDGVRADRTPPLLVGLSSLAKKPLGARCRDGANDHDEEGQHDGDAGADGDVLEEVTWEMVPHDKKDQKTVLKYHDIDFNIDLKTSFFSQQNMKRVR